MNGRLIALLLLSLAPAVRAAWRHRGNLTATGGQPAASSTRPQQQAVSDTAPPKYVATVTNFSTWVDRFFDRVPLPYPVAAVASGVVLYLLGLGATALYGFHETYVETFAVYPWIIAIVWMLGVIRWATARTRRMLLELRPVFLESDQAYDWVIDRLNRRCHSRAIGGGVVVVAALALWATVADFVDPSLYPFRFSLYPSTRNLPHPWYESHELENLLVLATVEIVCTALLVSALWYLAASMWFLVDIRNFRTVPVAGVVLSRCRSIANFYLIAFSTSFVGVGLYVVLARHSFDAPTLATIGALSLLCSLPALVPQMVFHRFLAEADAQMAEVATRLYHRHLSRPPVAADHLEWPEHPEALSNGLNLWFNIVQVATPSRTWIYDFSAIALLLLGQAITTAATVATVFMRDRFGIG